MKELWKGAMASIGHTAPHASGSIHTPFLCVRFLRKMIRASIETTSYPNFTLNSHFALTNTHSKLLTSLFSLNFSLLKHPVCSLLSMILVAFQNCIFFFFLCSIF